MFVGLVMFNIFNSGCFILIDARSNKLKKQQKNKNKSTTNSAHLQKSSNVSFFLNFCLVHVDIMHYVCKLFHKNLKVLIHSEYMHSLV